MADQYLDPLHWPITFAMDSGQLAENWTAPTDPVPIYTGTTLQSYNGTTVPTGGGDVTQYLIGPGGNADWPLSGPSISSNGHGQVYTTTAMTHLPGHLKCGASGPRTEHLPSRYTGLMRLAVQAKMGAGRNPDQLVSSTPESCTSPLSTASHGLIHDADYNFWLITASLSGVTAQKLKNASRVEWCRVNLASGAVTDDKFLAYLLAGLRVDDSVAAIELLTSAEMTATYGARTPIAHGWKFRRQTPFEASIVTVKEFDDGSEWALESTLSKIEFSFSGGVPSATITVEQDDAKLWLNPLKPLWIPDGVGGHFAYVPPIGRTKPAGAGNGVVYCYYDSDGTRQTLDWVDDHTESVSATSEQTVVVCGFGSESTEWHASYTGSLGGWKLAGIDYAAEDQTASRQINEKIYEIVQGNTGAWNSTNFPAPQTNCADGTSIYDELDPCDYKLDAGQDIETTHGHLVRTTTVRDIDILSYSQMVIIPAQEAEAAYIGRYKSEDVSDDIWTLDYSDAKKDWQADYNAMWLRSRYVSCPKNPSGDWLVVPVGYTALRSYSSVTTWAYGAGTNTHSTDDYQRSEIEVKIATATGIHDCTFQDDTDWQGVWSASLADPTAIIPAVANFSWRGDGYYSNQITDATDTQTIGGYPDLYGGSLPSNRAFIGWA